MQVVLRAGIVIVKGVAYDVKLVYDIGEQKFFGKFWFFYKEKRIWLVVVQ